MLGFEALSSLAQTEDTAALLNSTESSHKRRHSRRYSRTAAKLATRYCCTYSQGYAEVTVAEAVVLYTPERGRYTEYTITLETNNRAFNLKASSVKRCYSEFRWLRTQLGQHFPDITPPALPSLQLLGREFSPEVIRQRITGLQGFLSLALEQPVYLSDATLHLFLQSPLTVHGITDVIERRTGRGVCQTIMGYSTELNRQSSHTSTLSDASSGYNSSVDCCAGSSSSSLLVPCRHKQKRGSLPGHTASPEACCTSGATSSVSPPATCADGATRCGATRVTFIQGITVTDAIDQLDMSPRKMDKTMVPSGAIARTVAY